MLKTIPLAIALAFAAAGAAFAADPAMVGETVKGKTLVDAKGMTLYTFDKDAAGKSACNGQCAVNWPPLMAPKEAKAMGAWTVVTRDDGATMWAYKGKPLYTYINDKKAGDVVGEGMAGNTWHVATP